ncbi:hypothetical protein ANCDUO_01680 [Ancylostoma duodenale]|uniref:Uncharacterized protein n=1 Tax=Ancylostoma duodenale TaxID=51022 RepID=A0A0C2DYB7_9BILA|nr:hypothetical protein ANCDUO_01680 [Ancylostoma duodenale]
MMESILSRFLWHLCLISTAPSIIASCSYQNFCNDIPLKQIIVPRIEHHLLPDHFRKDSFFGRVRSFAPFANHPFPAPPLPPSPPPENIKKTTTG